MYAKKLKFIEYRNELKQKDAAKVLEISEGMYSKYKNEIQIFPIIKLKKLCDFYNISLDYIFNLTEKINYPHYRKEIDKELMSKRLKELRKNNKLTQEQFASILSIGTSTLAEYERGTYIISTYTLYSLSMNYNISSDYLLGVIDTPKYINC